MRCLAVISKMIGCPLCGIRQIFICWDLQPWYYHWQMTKGWLLSFVWTWISISVCQTGGEYWHSQLHPALWLSLSWLTHIHCDCSFNSCSLLQPQLHLLFVQTIMVCGVSSPSWAQCCNFIYYFTGLVAHCEHSIADAQVTCRGLCNCFCKSQDYIAIALADLRLHCTCICEPLWSNWASLQSHVTFSICESHHGSDFMTHCRQGIVITFAVSWDLQLNANTALQLH